MIPSSENIVRAKEILETIEQLQAELTSLFGVAAPATSAKRPGRPSGNSKKGGMSAEGRARIAAAAKARWARFRASKSGVAKASAAAKPGAAVKAAAPASAAGTTAKKRKMSAAGRAAIIAAQKARWAKVRAEKKEKA